MRRGVVLAFLAVAAMLASFPAAHAQTGVPVVVLDGKGFGHGVGLAQWGAKYLADAGASHSDILATFYPGTTISTVGDEEIRVSVFTSGNGQTTWTFPNGGEVRSSPSGDQAPGFPVRVGPGGAVVVSYDGAYHVQPVLAAQSTGSAVVYESPSQTNCIPLVTCPPTTQPGSGNGGGGGGGCLLCSPTTPPPSTSPPATQPPPSSSDPGPPPSDGPGDTTPPPPSTEPAASSSPVWAVPDDGGVVGVSDRGRHYRGLLEATADAGPLRVIDQLGVEEYVKGMGEVPGSWPIEAIGAQAVAARTYALRAMAASGEICDYDLCQVYIGADNESAGQDAAVDATRGEVLTYDGGLADTVYSADAGGITATTLEGFGSPDGVYPYLTTVRYNTPDPLPWRSEIALSDIGARFGYPGTVTDVAISQAGPSGRALTVTLNGDSGPATVDGRQFAARLGLRSTLFQPTITTDDNVPPPPPDGSVLQAFPDDAAALKQAALATSAVTRTPDLAGMRRWGASLAPAAHKAADLASHPATWLALLLLEAATVLALRESGWLETRQRPGVLSSSR